MRLKEIVPWGRNMSEYVSMFSLEDEILSGNILGCGDGPSSFNAEATRKGFNVTSVDPIYAYSKEAIANRIAEARTEIMEQVYKNVDSYVWKYMESPEELESIRLAAMQAFLADFTAGLEAERYIPGSAPELKFGDRQFSLALSSHFLFLYSNQFSLDSHIKSIRSLMRVADQVRIFPLHAIHNGEISEHLEPVLLEMRNSGFSADVVGVDYEFMRGAKEMLVISR